MATVEIKLPGFYARPLAGIGEELLSQSLVDRDVLAVDMVWLDGDLEETAFHGGRMNADLLTGASNCLVESAGKLVFLAGTLQERNRGREYLTYMTSRRFGKKAVIPDLETRVDAITLKVPKEAVIPDLETRVDAITLK